LGCAVQQLFRRDANADPEFAAERIRLHREKFNSRVESGCSPGSSESKVKNNSSALQSVRWQGVDGDTP
jgi:hypothetical protein